MKIAFVSYGHTRTPEHAHVPRNSCNLTFFGSLLGTQKYARLVGADLVDLSPLLDPGVDWDAFGRIPDALEPADVLVAQAGVSHRVVKRMREINPKCKIIVQRDSTHARVHLELMKGGMKRHGISWTHFYEMDGNCERDEEEYALADWIFVLSKWVHHTFVAMKLGAKTIQFASQLVEVERWKSNAPKPRFPFTATFVGQTGIRKGTFDLLEAWRIFYVTHPGAVLNICGLPEHGAPPELAAKLDREYAATPGLRNLGWVDPSQMRRVYEESHVLVAPSWEDGGTMVGPEAALAGCAIVATRNAGIDILDPLVGVEVEPGEPKQIADALSGIADTRLFEPFGQVARKRAERCGVDAYADGFARALGRVL